MDIVILGSGTAIPSSDRGSPSLALLLGESPVLFDLGPGTLRQLKRAGIPFHRIRHISITHFHPDHTGDLIHFLFATRNPSILGKRAPFRISGPEGLKDFVARLGRAYGKWLTLPPEIMQMEELDIPQRSRKRYGDFALFFQPVTHTPQSLAYRIEDPSGKSFVYSGETGYCHEIVALARGTDLLILESSFPEGHEVEGHLTPSQAGRIASDAGVKKLLLIHFYPEVLGTDMAKQCRKTYVGELILGRHLLHLPL